MVQQPKYTASVVPQQNRFAAMFADVENIYYYFCNRYPELAADAVDFLVDLIRNIKVYIEEQVSTSVIVSHAYADFERLESGVQGSLYLMGVETHNVLGTDHKNAADMRLCIDALETLYTRPNIETFVLLAGDRDYIPIMQHLRKEGRDIRVVAFRDGASGDLLQVIGEDRFIDAAALLSPALRFHLGEDAKRNRHRRPDAVAPQRSTAPRNGSSSTAGIPAVASFRPAGEITNEAELRAIGLMLDIFGQHEEIWVSPYLRRLSDFMPNLADFERKEIISALEAAGAIKVEKRVGHPHDYSVIIVNYEHPTVKRIREKNEEDGTALGMDVDLEDDEEVDDIDELDEEEYEEFEEEEEAD